MVETRLSSTSWQIPDVTVRSPTAAVGTSETNKGSDLLNALYVFGLVVVAAAYGEVASLQALHDGRATRGNFETATSALALESGVLVWLVIERAVVTIWPSATKWFNRLGPVVTAVTIIVLVYRDGSFAP